MSLFKLVRKNILAHPIRSSLTGLGATIAIFLLVFLRSIVTSLEDAVDGVANNRVITSSAVSLFQNLPESYGSKLAGVDGVQLVNRFHWFGGYHKDPANFFAQFAVDVDSMRELYPECQMSDDYWEAFLADRKGCIIGSELAKKFDWKVGDQVQLTGTIFPRPKGSWDFNVCGIYTTESSSFDPLTMYFHYEYLSETSKKDSGVDEFDAGLFVMKIDDADNTARICGEIDRIFAGGPQRTLTQPEAAFQAAFVSMLGDVPTFLGWIGAAVIFALGISLINTMLITSAERIRDIGVLKALGFTDGVCARQFIYESLTIAIGGGAIGCALGWFSIPFFRKAFGTNIPRYDVRDETFILAIGIAIVIGIVAGLVPAIRANRLDAAGALRAEI